MYGQRLRELRSRNGWTQRDLAREAGLAGRTISQIEQDIRLVSEPTIVKLIRLGLDVDGVTVPHLRGEPQERDGS